MKWSFRKSRSGSAVELTQSAPAKSILRTTDRRPNHSDINQDCLECEPSLVDLRSTEHGSLPRTSTTYKSSSTASLRTLDTSCRRNVLFLDEVPRSRKESSADKSCGRHRSPAMTPANYAAYSSYPSSYQPTPQLVKRGLLDSDDGIELVSRAYFTAPRNEPAGEICSNSSIKHAISSLTGGGGVWGSRKPRKSIDEEADQVRENGTTNFVDGLARSPVISTVRSDRHSTASGNAGKLLQRASSLATPAVRRPKAPTVIESRRSPRAYEYSPTVSSTPWNTSTSVNPAYTHTRISSKGELWRSDSNKSVPKPSPTTGDVKSACNGMPLTSRTPPRVSSVTQSTSSRQFSNGNTNVNTNFSVHITNGNSHIFPTYIASRPPTTHFTRHPIDDRLSPGTAREYGLGNGSPNGHLGQQSQRYITIKNTQLKS